MLLRSLYACLIISLSFFFFLLLFLEYLVYPLSLYCHKTDSTRDAAAVSADKVLGREGGKNPLCTLFRGNSWQRNGISYYHHHTR